MRSPNAKSQLIHDSAIRAERYSPPFPAKMINATEPEREKYVCECLFNKDELTLNNGLYEFKDPGTDRLLLLANNILVNRGLPNNLSIFPSEHLSSEDKGTPERAKFILHALLHNFKAQRSSQFDPYFDLPEKNLNTLFSGNFTELGPVLTYELPRGLVISEMRNTVERELVQGRDILTQILDPAKYQTNLNVRYNPKEDRFYQLKSEGWEMISEMDLWNHHEVPFLKAPYYGPQRFFLTKSYTNSKTFQKMNLTIWG